MIPVVVVVIIRQRMIWKNSDARKKKKEITGNPSLSEQQKIVPMRISHIEKVNLMNDNAL